MSWKHIRHNDALIQQIVEQRNFLVSRVVHLKHAFLNKSMQYQKHSLKRFKAEFLSEGNRYEGLSTAFKWCSEDLAAVIEKIIQEHDCIVEKSAIRKSKSHKGTRNAKGKVPSIQCVWFEAFRKNIESQIIFHQSNANDPHGIGNAVLSTLYAIRDSIPPQQ